LYKLLFLDPDDDTQAFKPRDFAERFLMNENTMNIAAKRQTLGTAGAKQPKAQDMRMEKARDFFKKLQSYELLREVSEETKLAAPVFES